MEGSRSRGVVLGRGVARRFELEGKVGYCLKDGVGGVMEAERLAFWLP